MKHKRRELERTIRYTFGLPDFGPMLKAFKQVRYTTRIAARHARHMANAVGLLMCEDPRTHPCKDNDLRRSLGLPRYRARRMRAIERARKD